MLKKNNSKHVSSPKLHIKCKKTAGVLVTESPDWDAAKNPVSIKTNNQLEKSRNQGQINHRNLSLFLSLLEGRTASAAARIDQEELHGVSETRNEYFDSMRQMVAENQPNPTRIRVTARSKLTTKVSMKGHLT